MFLIFIPFAKKSTLLKDDASASAVLAFIALVIIFIVCNLSVFSEIAEGWMVSDVITILGSLDIVLGEIDR